MLRRTRLAGLRKTGAFAGLVCVLSGCSAILGLRDIDEGQSLVDADGGSRDRDSATSGDVLVETPPADAADAADAGDSADAMLTGFCAAYPNALLCDDFEGAMYSSKWRAIAQSGVIRENHPAAQTPDGGDLISNFDPIPPTGKAALAFDGLPGGTHTFRFSIWVPTDSYPGDSSTGGMKVAALVDNSTGDSLHVELLGVSPPELWVRDSRGGAPIKGIYIAYDRWYCVSIKVDAAGTVGVLLDQMAFNGSATTATATGISTAEVGMTWLYGGNAGSMTLHFDDVVIGPGPDAIGCQ